MRTKDAAFAVFDHLKRLFAGKSRLVDALVDERVVDIRQRHGLRPDADRIAAQSVGLNLTKYKLMAFVTSAALAGAAGALYGLNYSSLQSVKFNFNTSILVLVFVVLGGLGNIWGSLLSAAALTILPEALRQFADYRMLVYAIVLIFVMLATNNPRFKAFFAKLLPRRHSVEEKEV